MPSNLPGAGQRFFQGILPENPVYRQLLAMCPTLAVTGTVAGATTMAGATAFVLICANVITSLLRNLLKPHLRILVFTVTIATFVTIADMTLRAFVPAMSALLGPYVPLIIVNCMIICRCEVCGSKQGPVPAAADAAGQSLGFLAAMLSISIPREILGLGTLLAGWVGPVVDGAPQGLVLLGDEIPKVALLALPPGAFFTLGLLLGAVNWVAAMRAERMKRAAEYDKVAAGTAAANQ
jgi:electron transport complex protein RnfE